MLTVFAVQSLLATLISLGMFTAQAFALIDAAVRRPEAFPAADKMTKQAWLIILGIAMFAHMLIWSPTSFLNLLGIVAALVYLLDARPALRAVSRGR